MLYIAYNNIYAHPLPDGHRFPMLKYELIPAQLLHEGSITEEHLFSPTICNLETVLQTHSCRLCTQINAPNFICIGTKKNWLSSIASN
jgi:acetoin utilization deacetylase AcuC-like enzyme